MGFEYLPAAQLNSISSIKPTIIFFSLFFKSLLGGTSARKVKKLTAKNPYIKRRFSLEPRGIYVCSSLIKALKRQNSSKQFADFSFNRGDKWLNIF